MKFNRLPETGGKCKFSLMQICDLFCKEIIELHQRNPPIAISIFIWCTLIRFNREFISKTLHNSARSWQTYQKEYPAAPIHL